MTEYTLCIFSVCVISGLVSLLCYGSGTAEKTAVGIITAFIIISPLVTAVKNIDIEAALDSLTGTGVEIGADPSLVAEEAFAKGIIQAVADKFSLDKENVRVKIVGFDLEKMSAEQIKITLSGVAVLADYRGIESYINSLEMGVCSVEIEIG